MATKQNIIDRFNQAQDSLVIQASDMSLETVASMVAANAIDVQPEYQRRERWSHEAQSALIESFLLNIPVPPIYLAEEDFGTYSVIDGKQRLTTIKKFMREEISLSRLERFPQLEGMKLQNLPLDLSNALRIRPYVRVVTLLKQSDPQLKYEVFTRLNTGGVPLQPQEIRNAMFRGPFNDLLVTLSSAQFLRQQLKIRTQREEAYLSMADVEYVLRFFSMNANWSRFSGDYRRSMDLFMDANRNVGVAKKRALRTIFLTSLERCEGLWGEFAFRRFDPNAGAYRDQFLSAVYDAQMISVAQLSERNYKKLLPKAAEISKSTRVLFKNPEFDDAIRLSTNTPARVNTRITAMTQLLETFL